MSEIYRVIGDGGEVPDGPRPEGLDDATLVEVFRSMVLLRTFDERAVALQRQGRIGTYPPFWGEEAAQAGPAVAARATDWLFPSYRQSAIGILRGLPPSTIFKYRRGFGGPHGFWDARRYRVGPMTVSIATQIPHAVGLAWAARIRREDVAAIVWFGDGATSEGDFHEALNFAAVMRTPTVLFCTNNQWAISTPFERQSATPSVAEKAVAYGLPSVRVDGFDPVACWKAASEALARARLGEGATLVEAFCYRIAPHGTADDPGRYRDASVTEKWRALEPVGRMRSYLARIGVLDDAGVEEIHARARRVIAEAVAELDALTDAGPEIMFDYVYAAGRPGTYDEGMAELEEVRARDRGGSAARPA